MTAERTSNACNAISLLSFCTSEQQRTVCTESSSISPDIILGTQPAHNGKANAVSEAGIQGARMAGLTLGNSDHAKLQD
jgi:hypothetical protein